MQITSNILRIGNFTNSENHRLVDIDSTLKMGRDKAENYIKEKNWERRMGRSITKQVDTRPMLWGKFLENRVHRLLPNSYIHQNDVTIRHDFIDYWSGTPDNLVPTEKVVGDTKCPDPKAFCELVDLMTEACEVQDPSIFKAGHPKYYWQLVGNGILVGAEFIELILYMPYESELEEIREEANNYDGDEPWKYRFIYESLKEELPYLPDGCDYKNLYTFRLPLDKEDAKHLTKCVIKAGQQLNQRTIKKQIINI